MCHTHSFGKSLLCIFFFFPQLKTSAQYFVKSLNSHQPYALLFLMCEFIGTTITIANLFITNAFLGGYFLQYGMGSLGYLLGRSPSQYSPLDEVFPKVSIQFFLIATETTGFYRMSWTQTVSLSVMLTMEITEVLENRTSSN